MMDDDMYMSRSLPLKCCGACADANGRRSRGRGAGRDSLMIRCLRNGRSIHCIRDLLRKQRETKRLASGELCAGPNASSTIFSGHKTYILI